MTIKQAIQFIKQEFPEIDLFMAEKGVLKFRKNGKNFTVTLRNHSRETLDRQIKDCN